VKNFTDHEVGTFIKICNHKHTFYIYATISFLPMKVDRSERAKKKTTKSKLQKIKK